MATRTSGTRTRTSGTRRANGSAAKKSTPAASGRTVTPRSAAAPAPDDRDQSNRSTATDLNAGHGTQGDAAESKAGSAGTQRGIASARTRPENLGKASPDGPQDGGADTGGYEGESLRERGASTDVEGGAG